jgi:hypothetical protein
MSINFGEAEEVTQQVFDDFELDESFADARED